MTRDKKRPRYRDSNEVVWGLIEKISYKSSVLAILRQVVLEYFPPNNDGVNNIFNFHSREIERERERGGYY